MRIERISVRGRMARTVRLLASLAWWPHSRTRSAGRGGVIAAVRCARARRVSAAVDRSGVGHRLVRGRGIRPRCRHR